MSNIISAQGQDARKKIKLNKKISSEIDNSLEDLFEVAEFRVAEINSKILSSLDFSKILKSETLSDNFTLGKSISQRNHHYEMDAEFDKAVAAITSAADTASRMTLELGEDLARIAAMRERIDRQNSDNAKALKALLQGA